MTKKQLESRTKDELLELARKKRVPGRQGMSKADLIASLMAPLRENHRRSGSRRLSAPVTRSSRSLTKPARKTSPNLPELKSRAPKQEAERTNKKSKSDLPGLQGQNKQRDRIVLLVRDAYWLHVTWDLTDNSIRRAEAALGHDWFSAYPVLRLYDVSSDETTSSSASVIRDIRIHGGVTNWYIDVAQPPRSFRVDIGYLTAGGKFYSLARSNVVTTPRPGGADVVDRHWKSVTEDCERILAMSTGNEPIVANELREFFEEKLRRPLNAGSLSNYGSGALSQGRRRGFHFNIDAELIVYGSSDPHARVTLQGEPVQLRPDGTFTLRFALAEGRQIIPATAHTNDGIEERTIILAVERNTKELEPMVHDGQE